MRIYLSGVDVLRLHHALIEREGGLHGISNSAEIDAVLGRASGGESGDILSEAAALIDGFLTKRHFVDGNRRVAFAAAHTFLGLNGVEITASPEDALAFISRYGEGESPGLEEIKRWLDVNTAPA